jgi:hypothetical protein
MQGYPFSMIAVIFVGLFLLPVIITDSFTALMAQLALKTLLQPS